MAGTPERNAALESDPVFGARKALKLERKPGDPGDKRAFTLREMLPELARAYTVSIIADAYERGPMMYGLPGTEPIPLYLFLDRWLGYEYHWDSVLTRPEDSAPDLASPALPAAGAGPRAERGPDGGRLVRLRSRQWFLVVCQADIDA